MSCDLPNKEMIESSAHPKQAQLLSFIHAYNDSISIQLIYGLKPLAPAKARPTVISANVGYMGRKLEVIFSGYIAPDITNKSIRNRSVAINHPIIGDLSITRLPSSKAEWNLDHIPVSFIAATDKVDPRHRPTNTYSTDICVVTKPSNWKAKSFIDIYNQPHTILIEDQVYSFPYNYKRYCVNSNDSSAIIGMCESPEFSSDPKLLEPMAAYITAQTKIAEQSYKRRIVSLLKNIRFHASKDAKSSQFKSIPIKPEYMEPLEQLSYLIAFYNENKHKMNRPYVLLMPNFEKVFMNISNDEILAKLGNNIRIVEYTTDININDDCIYILRTGNLHPEVFDYLTTLPNMLPAVVEGCNAVELCEFNGSPFLLTNNNGYTVQNLPSDDINFNCIQNLHINASLYLSHGKEEHRPHYVNYMHLAIENPQALEKYSEQRKQIYRETFCDVIDRSLSIIAAVGIQSQSNLYPCIKPSLRI